MLARACMCASITHTLLCDVVTAAAMCVCVLQQVGVGVGVQASVVCVPSHSLLATQHNNTHLMRWSVPPHSEACVRRPFCCMAWHATCCCSCSSRELPCHAWQTSTPFVQLVFHNLLCVPFCTGTIKRWKHHRGLMTHGSKSHREHGSTGQSATPSRVFPGLKMAGRMGNARRVVKQQEVRRCFKQRTD